MGKQIYLLLLACGCAMAHQAAVHESHRTTPKDRDTMSVMDLGAKGDCVTDDTEAFQSFFTDYVQTTSYSGRNSRTLFVPAVPNCYKITAPITIGINKSVTHGIIMVGWHVIGESRMQSQIRQFTNNVPVFEFRGEFIHSWSFEKLHIDYAAQQPPANTRAVAFLCQGTNTGQTFMSPYDGMFDQINISNAFRGFASDVNTNRSSGFFFSTRFTNIWGMSTMTGATLYFNYPAIGIERLFLSGWQIDGAANTYEEGIALKSCLQCKIESISFLRSFNQLMTVVTSQVSISDIHIEGHDFVTGIPNKGMTALDLDNSSVDLTDISYANGAGHSVCAKCNVSLIRDYAGGNMAQVNIRGLYFTPVILAGGSAVAFLGGKSQPSYLSIENYVISASGGGVAPTLYSPSTLVVNGQLAKDQNINYGTFVENLGTKFTTTHGANATSGVVALSSGTATVSTSAIAPLAAAGASGDVINLVLQTCSNCGTLSVGTVTAGASFVVNSTNRSDSSNVYWEIRHIN